jgi:hypothetical protein
VALAAAVKSLLRPSARRLSWLILASLLVLQPRALAQGILLGPVPQRSKSRAEYDPALPTGAARAPQMARDEAGLKRACSPARPLCVTWSAGDQSAPVFEALTQLQIAYDDYVLSLGLPAPGRADTGEPLTWQLRAVDSPIEVLLRPSLTLGFDTAAVLCRGGARTDLLRSAHLCVGEAIAARLDPAETPATRRAYALWLWWVVGRLHDSDVQLLARAAALPQVGLFSPGDDASAAASALFLEYADRTLAARGYGQVPTALLALSAQRTSSTAWRYVNQPDIVDVLRATFEDDLSTFAHKVADFAMARTEARFEKGPLARFAELGELIEPRQDWIVPVSTLPRRVAPALPLGPLGSTYVRVDFDVPADNLTLALSVDWEPPSPMIWQVAKLGPDGQPLGRIEVAFEPRQYHAERRLLNLAGVRSLLIVGTNLGGVDLAHPFDPDHAPFEPHNCSVYLARM